ncbi:Casein kinase I [Operophtera brumata]|uniref:Casein kinase I n=1 Tax=Operophtera brumata TaxID=104452 RepID=A0A0L7LDH4_OPEBR|nr:Casein kinase I [Operophtera brumata]
MLHFGLAKKFRDLRTRSHIAYREDKNLTDNMLHFGLAKKFRDLRTRSHIAYREDKNLTG